ncbi:MAG TPA: tetratricopeptide repeat protein [Gemmataceae bacterium]|jgi:Flp pilus assembly protein TadD|nr:tetratricopeptide repeat protein [Gemmataceae bacterium]
MFQARSFVSICFVCVAFLSPQTRSLAAKDSSWVGKQVMPKTAELQIGHTDKEGKQVYVAKLTDFIYTVIQEEGDHILLRHKGVTGWLPKTEAVPLQEASAFFTTRLSKDPKDDYAFAGRGVASQHRGDLDGAIKDLTRAIELKPDLAVWRNNRGVVYADKKDFDKAFADFKEAIRLDPTSPLPFNNRAGIYLSQNEFDKAIADFAAAIHANAKDPDAHAGRGLAYEKKKDYEQALADYEAAARLDPNDPATLNNPAWLLATCPKNEVRNGKKAIEYALKAAKLCDWKIPGVLDTLAAAYAEDGQFALAVKWQKQALEDAEYTKENGAEAQARLKLYEAGKPYQEKESKLP